MESMTILRGKIPSVLLAALVLALSRLQSTGAVDCLFYTLANCQGTAVGCFNLTEGACCGLAAASWRPSVRVQNSNSCKRTSIYSGGFCTTLWGSFVGNFCVTGSRFTEVERHRAVELIKKAFSSKLGYCLALVIQRTHGSQIRKFRIREVQHNGFVRSDISTSQQDVMLERLF
ncbi:hypothetical protein Mp_8g16680 [Marchantia polymorpha subsp. ruderalis]|uniref:Bifunctional inhibitor/plant lipid transfer protein/seed storage helical domain-containing protein n=1 Tax=Marchantia polymorpha TaxID=3197 RepID=A0A2R6X826_MARPO|nr:hypothetical protein MARPO_0030s0003 [Marchantia polymorpha]BBN20131.1 hypothetical protein Mp_8g16680 [Marchantia polymorpha subsp. ruderalis]|eukprot:PTQ42247.1 hypothetical protein MARPO_0030s0003 [Marchantia polymorpha]